MIKGFKNITAFIDGEFKETSIKIEDGKIVDFSYNDDFLTLPDDAIVLPGFIDEHVHGVLNSDAMDANINAFETISTQLAKEGTTAFLITTMTASKDDISNSLITVKECAKNGLSGAEVLGIHLEGPFINTAKAGAQPKEYIATLDEEVIKNYVDLSDGLIRLITVAPEMPNADKFIKTCLENGITVSAGHTSATYQEFLNAVDNGVSCTTHTFNAMSAFSHREIGVAGASMLEDRVYNEVIADGVHVSIPAIKLLAKTKKDKLILVTDSMRAKNIGDGESELGGQKVYVKNGEARLIDGTLAGSILKLSDAFKNVIVKVGLTLAEAVKATSENPAKNLKVFDNYGSISVGKRANFTVINRELDVIMTVVGGKIVYER
ncbi:MAG: N-acetylglucosamine-6-phosphate deacetylase [Clostridia bacterium]|nr:N-acetylglucosamine-6-phosphate deacetylase [Clostridia bacterium]